MVDAGIAAQFVDLGARLQLTNRAVNLIVQDVNVLTSKSEARHAELLNNMVARNQLDALDARLQRIEQMLKAMQRDLEGSYRDRFNQLHETLKSSHLSLSETLQDRLLNGK